jgi:hypothetical protein
VITVKARFDGRVFVPQVPIELPAGSEVDLQITTAPALSPRRTLAELAEIARQFPVNPDLPTDLAAQHDHYLSGTPKRP